MSEVGGNYASPANQAAAVTKSDATVFAETSRALYVGGAGDVAVRMAGPDGNAVTFVAVPAGAWLPLRVSQVLAAGTTATSIVRVW